MTDNSNRTQDFDTIILRRVEGGRIVLELGKGDIILKQSPSLPVNLAFVQALGYCFPQITALPCDRLVDLLGSFLGLVAHLAGLEEVNKSGPKRTMS